jgi:hypothetical protein
MLFERLGSSTKRWRVWIGVASLLVGAAVVVRVLFVAHLRSIRDATFPTISSDAVAPVTAEDGSVIVTHLPELIAAARQRCIPILAMSDVSASSSWVATSEESALRHINDGVANDSAVVLPEEVFDIAISAPSRQASVSDKKPPSPNSALRMSLSPKSVPSGRTAMLTIDFSGEETVGNSVVADLASWNGALWMPFAQGQVSLHGRNDGRKGGSAVRSCPTAWFDPVKALAPPSKGVDMLMTLEGYERRGRISYDIDLPVLAPGWYQIAMRSPIEPHGDMLRTVFRVTEA